MFKMISQVDILRGYLPRGRVVKQGFVAGSNFTKVLQWLGASFEWLTTEYNKTASNIFICSTDNITPWLRDYGIPNDTFYTTSDAEHKIDIFVLKYLMRGNLEQNYKDIASAYNINIEVTNGTKYYEDLGFTYKFPVRFGKPENMRDLIVITLPPASIVGFVYKFPIKLGNSATYGKIMKIFENIKSAETEIKYVIGDVADNKGGICKI